MMRWNNILVFLYCSLKANSSGGDSLCLDEVIGGKRKGEAHTVLQKRFIEYEIFGEGSHISTNQRRESTVFSLLIG